MKKVFVHKYMLVTNFTKNILLTVTLFSYFLLTLVMSKRKCSQITIFQMNVKYMKLKSPFDFWAGVGYWVHSCECDLIFVRSSYCVKQCL